MKYYSGTYGKETIEQNALVTNLLKYPEISKALIRQYPQYSLSYFLEGTGRFAKEELIGDNSFKWAILGRLNRPSTVTVQGANATPGLDVEFSLTLDENYLNLYDVVKFAVGHVAVVTTVPTSAPYVYGFKFVAGTAPSVNTNTILAGSKLGTVGSMFPESSTQGFENHVYPDWYVNYLTITRKAKSISGSALTDITWIENNGQRLWYFTDQNLVMEEYLYQLELSRWYGKTSANTSGVAQITQGGKKLLSGDGILAQIGSANTATYNTTTNALDEAKIAEFIAQLSLNAGVKNNEFMVFTGTAGRLAFHKAMVNHIQSGSSLAYDLDAGRNVTVGANFTTYVALGHKITLVHCPLFDDPNLHFDMNGTTGFPKESYRMVFMNMGVTNGVANVEVKVKGAAGIDRGMIVKYIPGMVNPFDQKSMIASNSRDSFTCEILSESGIIVRNPLSCGMLTFA